MGRLSAGSFSAISKAQFTMWPVLVLIVYCILIAIASLIGGWLPAMMRLTHTRMQMMMSFVGGLMMAVALLHLLPHAVMETGSLNYASSSAMLGLLAIFFMIRVFHVHQHAPGEPHGQPALEASADPDHLCHHHAHETTSHSHQLSWVGLFIGMSIHSLIDGIALAASVTVSAEHDMSAGLLGVGTFVAVLLHKPLDALPIATVMMAGGWGDRARQLVNVIYALICPAGALMFYFGIHGLLAEQHLASFDRREHIGMGVLLAQAGARWQDAYLLDAAKLNQRFVLDKLQDADGTVCDSARNRTVQRLYNYPWVAQLHLELGDLDACLKTSSASITGAAARSSMPSPSPWSMP